ncbi:MAG TPA: hypothetical protein VMY77_14070 [Chitinophagaceae bacterium]|nr:hypothetical protein [Chitinophagaceae bacterium]
MKKILLIAMLIFFGSQTFSFSPGNAKTNLSYVTPGNLKGISLEEFLKLTPKKYEELTGKKMSFKHKIGFAILKAKLKKQLADETPAKKSNLGTMSLIFGIVGVLSIFSGVAALGVIGFFAALAALILGIKALRRDGRDTKALFGVILGGGYMILLIIAVIVLSSWNWY